MTISPTNRHFLPTISERCETTQIPMEIELFETLLKRLENSTEATDSEKDLCKKLLSQTHALAIYIQERSSSDSSDSSANSSPPSTPRKIERAVTPILSPLPLLNLSEFKRA